MSVVRSFTVSFWAVCILLLLSENSVHARGVLREDPKRPRIDAAPVERQPQEGAVLPLSVLIAKAGEVDPKVSRLSSFSDLLALLNSSQPPIERLNGAHKTLQDLARHQFGKFKPIREIVSNALDASTGTSQPRQAEIFAPSYQPDLLQVGDRGRGMGIHHGVHALLTPFRSGPELESEGLQSTERIGQFGQGFLSSLSFLDRPQDYITVFTKKEGELGISITLYKLWNEFWVKIAPEQLNQTGTWVEIKSSVLTRIENGKTFRDILLGEVIPFHFRYSRNAIVRVNERSVVKDLSQMTQGHVLTPNGVSTEVFFCSQPSESHTGTVSLLVKDVVIQELKISGENICAETIIYLTPGTRLTSDRDHIDFQDPQLREIILSLGHFAYESDQWKLFNSLAALLSSSYGNVAHLLKLEPKDDVLLLPNLPGVRTVVSSGSKAIQTIHPALFTGTLYDSLPMAVGDSTLKVIPVQFSEPGQVIQFVDWKDSFLILIDEKVKSPYLKEIINTLFQIKYPKKRKLFHLPEDKGYLMIDGPKEIAVEGLRSYFSPIKETKYRNLLSKKFTERIKRNALGYKSFHLAAHLAMEHWDRKSEIDLVQHYSSLDHFLVQMEWFLEEINNSDQKLNQYLPHLISWAPYFKVIKPKVSEAFAPIFLNILRSDYKNKNKNDLFVKAFEICLSFNPLSSQPEKLPIFFLNTVKKVNIFKVLDVFRAARAACETSSPSENCEEAILNTYDKAVYLYAHLHQLPEQRRNHWFYGSVHKESFYKKASLSKPRFIKSGLWDNYVRLVQKDQNWLIPGERFGGYNQLSQSEQANIALLAYRILDTQFFLYHLLEEEAQESSHLLDQSYLRQDLIYRMLDQQVSLLEMEEYNRVLDEILGLFLSGVSDRFQKTMDQLMSQLDGKIQLFKSDQDLLQFLEAKGIITPTNIHWVYPLLFGLRDKFSDTPIPFAGDHFSKDQAIPLDQHPEFRKYRGNDSALNRKTIAAAIHQNPHNLAWMGEFFKNSFEAHSPDIHLRVGKDTQGRLLVQFQDHGVGAGRDKTHFFYIPGLTSKPRDKEDPNFGIGLYSAFSKFAEVTIETSENGIHKSTIYLKEIPEMGEGYFEIYEKFEEAPVDRIDRGTRFTFRTAEQAKASDPTTLKGYFIQNKQFLPNIKAYFDGVSVDVMQSSHIGALPLISQAPIGRSWATLGMPKAVVQLYACSTSAIYYNGSIKPWLVSSWLEGMDPIFFQWKDKYPFCLNFNGSLAQDLGRRGFLEMRELLPEVQAFLSQIIPYRILHQYLKEPERWDEVLPRDFFERFRGSQQTMNDFILRSQARLASEGYKALESPDSLGGYLVSLPLGIGMPSLAGLKEEIKTYLYNTGIVDRDGDYIQSAVFEKISENLFDARLHQIVGKFSKGIRNKIQEQSDQLKTSQKIKNDMDGSKIQDFLPYELPSPIQFDRKVLEKFKIFFEMQSKTLFVSEREIRFYADADASTAHALQWSNQIAFNLLGDEVKAFQELMRQRRFDVQVYLAWMETLTHEITHTYEQPSSSTHHDSFRMFQQAILSKLLLLTEDDWKKLEVYFLKIAAE